MEYKIVSSSSSERLTEKVNEHIKNGWEPVGSHQVLIQHSQNRFRGTQHVDTLNEFLFTQTIIKK